MRRCADGAGGDRPPPTKPRRRPTRTRATTPACSIPTACAARGLGIMRGTNVDPKIQPLYDAAIALLRRGAQSWWTMSASRRSSSSTAAAICSSGSSRPTSSATSPSGRRRRPIKTLDDLVAFNRREAAREMPYFSQETVEASALRGPLTSPEYLQLKERLLRAARADGIDATMQSQRLDAIVTLSGGPARPIDLVSGDSGGGTGIPGVTGIAATAGYPHITVPMGYVHGLPVGLSFTRPGLERGPRCSGWPLPTSRRRAHGMRRPSPPDRLYRRGVRCCQSYRHEVESHQGENHVPSSASRRRSRGVRISHQPGLRRVIGLGPAGPGRCGA